MSSDERPSSKYRLTRAERFRLHHGGEHGVEWDPHAGERWTERVVERAGWTDYPDPVTAYGAGEHVEDPELLKPPNQRLTRARVFNEAREGGGHTGRLVVFLELAVDGGGYKVKTVVRGDQYQHAPTRAYLYAHGPHEVDA